MARKNRTPEENARREKIRELLQMANIGSMDDIQSPFKETIAEFMENGLEAELDDRVGFAVIRKIFQLQHKGLGCTTDTVPITGVVANIPDQRFLCCILTANCF